MNQYYSTASGRLRGLAAGRGKEGSSARSALILAEKCTVADTGALARVGG